MARIKVLIDGEWHGDVEETIEIARLLRERGSTFRDWVTVDGAPGPTGARGFKAEPGRYHLYVSYACPWAHRTILYRRLKVLEHVIGMSVLHPQWGSRPAGWAFEPDPAFPGTSEDQANGYRFLHELYRAAAPRFTGRVTVPVLWDTRERTIVSNESGDIVRMLNSAFDAWSDASVDFYPAPLRDGIDRLNAVILPKLCVGVYRAGFARTQTAYDDAVIGVFQTLEWLEGLLSDERPYLLGDRITESDWHVFCTLVRFDAAYHGALKCNLKRLIDFPRLTAYVRRIYERPGVAETVRAWSKKS